MMVRLPLRSMMTIACESRLLGVLRMGRAWTPSLELAQRPIALGVPADRGRQFHVKGVGCPDAGGGNREIGRWSAQRLFDMAGGDPVVAMRQHVDTAQEVDTDAAGDQKSWQVIEVFWPARRAAGQGPGKGTRPIHQRGDRLLDAVPRVFPEAGSAIDEVRDRADGDTGGSCDIRYGRALALQCLVPN